MADHSFFANLIRQIADLPRGPYRPPQYERVMLPTTLLRRFDCVLAKTKRRALAAHKRRAGGRLTNNLRDHHAEARLYVYGQDYNPRAFATAASGAVDVGSGP